MKRFIPWIGVCVLLVISQTAAEKKNQKQFWDLFGKDESPISTRDGLEFDDYEGSGGDILTNKGDVTHVDEEDDEDFDDGISGDGIDKDKVDNTDIVFTDKDKPSTSGTTNKPALHTTKKPITDDEDLFEGSGSGHHETLEGSTKAPVVVTSSSSSRPLTACENLRSTALDKAVFIPECEEDGGFRKQQCTVDNVSKTKVCWCVDPRGQEIKGTRMVFPKVPDCDFGSNLKSCVFQRVQHSQGLLGAYKPTCTDSGEYEPVQCHERECWCVDTLGNELPGSVKTDRTQLNCSPSTKGPILTATKAPVNNTSRPATSSTTKKPVDLPKPGYTIPIDEKDEVIEEPIVTDVVVDVESAPGKKPEPENNYGENNRLDNMVSPTKHDDSSMLAQPGLLAAVIGGAVVGLLCMILLVMFIVYRMKKKDEGSYPLDEQKYLNYTYNKAPDKEFYA
ncbi:uncharacterized protein LOC127859050 isoform X2 [Dreissena polymorpha]|uniref:uncharacterized protein LOC127859050 isoform X2 n=1 Tax=Dreissena polymorpha TaxID=45954 RepID=UPI0022656D29|nr:uncharacterized protein LOC127859050 isoform X2 [Dreissena polymorpha]